MKSVITMVAVTAVFVLILSNTSIALASNGWGLEDPQLCVSGQLLTVIPTGPADVFVTVPEGATVSQDVSGCGGNPDIGIVPMENVTFQGGNMLRVTAGAEDGTDVTFAWGSQTVTKVAKHGEAAAKFEFN